MELIHALLLLQLSMQDTLHIAIVLLPLFRKSIPCIIINVLNEISTVVKTNRRKYMVLLENHSQISNIYFVIVD